MATKALRYGAAHHVSRRNPEKHKHKQIENIDLILEQIYKAHKYKNKLIEIEIARREAREARQLQLNPRYHELGQRIEQQEQLLKELYAEQAAHRVKTQTKTTPKELRDKIKQAKQDKAQLCKDKQAARLAMYVAREPEYEKLQEQKAAKLKSLKPAERKKALKEDADLIAITERLHKAGEMFDDIDQEAKDQARAARAECGVYWGTYLLVEDAVEQIKQTSKGLPKFRKFDGTGAVGVHFQSDLANTSTQTLFDGGTSIAAIEGGDNSTGFRKLKLRIGSDEKRKPIWATIPFNLHRPLPEGTVSHINLHRKRVGPDYRYEVQFVVKSEEESKAAERGAVGIDIGHRRVEQGLRVAVWVGSDGKTGEVILPERLLKQYWAKARDLRGIRDNHFNEVKARLQTYLQSSKAPEWLLEETKTLAQWRSQARLCMLLHKWSGERYEGDEQIYAALQKWRGHDKHLYLWERYAERKAENCRTDIYRCLAVELRQQYAECHIEDLDLRKMQQAPPSEDEQRDPALLYWRKNACLSKLVDALKQSGMALHKWPSKNTTRRCHCCGHINTWLSQAEQVLQCQNCKKIWDQDQNAAINLLAAAEWSPDDVGSEAEELAAETAAA